MIPVEAKIVAVPQSTKKRLINFGYEKECKARTVKRRDRVRRG